jgi:hypothetical protein
MIELPLLGDYPNTDAHSINDAGQVVGSSFSGAFMYDDGRMTYLLDVFPADSGWTSVSATDINDIGWIGGIGINGNGVDSGFLLTPIDPGPNLIPLPPAAVAGAATMAGVAAASRLRRRHSSVAN